MNDADLALMRLENAISNIDYPGSDSAEWEFKAKVAAKALFELIPHSGIERTDEWWVLGHPGWPGGIDLRSQARAEEFFWENPKIDGTRDGMRIMHRINWREADYVPPAPEAEPSDA